MTHLEDRTDPLVHTARSAATAAGVTGLLSLVGVIGGEVMVGTTDFMGSPLATVTAWLGFASACLLVLGVTGLLATVGRDAGTGARRALVGMQLAATVTAGAAATLPLVVVGIVDRAPELVDEPPTAVPATFILAGFALGVSGIALAVLLRRRAAFSARLTTFLLVASVVTIVPLPSRQFLVGFAVAALLATVQRAALAAPAARRVEDSVSPSPAEL
jgi:hypothetical protein